MFLYIDAVLSLGALFLFLQFSAARSAEFFYTTLFASLLSKPSLCINLMSCPLVRAVSISENVQKVADFY